MKTCLHCQRLVCVIFAPSLIVSRRLVVVRDHLQPEPNICLICAYSDVDTSVPAPMMPDAVDQ